MSLRSIFVAVTIATGLLLAAIFVHGMRPETELAGPTPALVRATGKCAECHLNETSAIVWQYETSEHAAAGVTCLECHRPAAEQSSVDHNGFLISAGVTSANCRQCHVTEYEQFARSRHALPAWAAVVGTRGMTPEMIATGETHHPGAVDRPANELAQLEGPGAIQTGCLGCHDIGQPNADGSIGTCTACHSRHSTSIVLAREPQTCGQCHMGPDHSQIEIYNESKHGVMYNAQKALMNLAAEPKELTTRDMPVPTCSTCHMSGLEGQRVTHDTTERLSYWLFAAVSERRPHYASAQVQMQETCTKCHATGQVTRFYEEAEVVVAATNEKVREAEEIVTALRADGLLTPEPFDEPIEFIYFDLWHYYGRTAKHGAFMGGADFVQWHGNYELLLKLTEIQEMASEIRAGH